MKKLFILFVMVAGFATVTFAQPALGTHASLATPTAEAKILVPITLLWNDVPLKFGEIVHNTATPDSVGMYPTNDQGAVIPTGRAFTGGVVGSGSLTGDLVSCPKFTVGGSISTAFSITLPATITVNNTVTPGSSMTINQLKVGSNEGGGAYVCAAAHAGYQLLANGSYVFTVGGDLHLIAAQGSGIYTGTYQVDVDYD